MATNPMRPGADNDGTSVAMPGGTPTGVPRGRPPGIPVGAAMGQPMPGGPMPGGPMPGGPMGRPGGPGGRPGGRPPGLPPGAMVMGGMPRSSVPTESAWFYIKRSLPLLRPLRFFVLASIVLGFLVTLLPFVTPAVWGPIVAILGKVGGQDGTGSLQGIWDVTGPRVSRPNGPSSGPTFTFAGWLGIWAVSLVLFQVLSFVRAWADAQVDWRLQTEIRQRVHDHLQSLSLDFFTGARSGALMQRVQMESSGVQKLLTDCLIPPVIDSVVLLVALGYLLSLSWQMTVVSLILAPLALFALRFAGRRVQGAQQRMMNQNRELGGELEETISGISDIQIFNAQGRRSQRFRAASGSAAKSSAMMIVWLQASSKGVQTFIALSTAVVLIVGVAFSQRFGLTVNTLIVFVGFVPTMFGPAQRIIDVYTQYKSNAPMIASTYELLDTKPSIAERADAVKLPKINGNIVFDNVVFGYTPDQKILNGASFSIKEGETVALVGSIGAGKSTIFNLLLRFLDPDNGRVVLDGHDVKTVSLNTLREQVSKLSQFPFFLKDTIRENVRLGRQDASDAEVEEACALAHIHSVIIDPARIAGGYNTIVDVQVPSGGQKRLIAMARCLLRKPEVLLLDEPTENLDADQRVRMVKVIREYARDRTCIVISHDMDFIAAVADRIIALDGGRVVEEGTHQELMSRDGFYRRLNEAQNVDPNLVGGTAQPGG